MMSQLPDDILTTHILSRLPVKDLMRCRCVLKSWCKLIDSSDFLEIQLKHSNETNSNTGVLLRSKQNNELHWLDLNTLEPKVKLNLPMDPIKCKDCGYEVLGSCNGLLALSASNNLFALWNPFTQRYINFSIPETKDEGNSSSKSYLYGFGYDPKGDDYKLVRIFGLREDNAISVRWLDIYRIKKKSQRRVSDCPFCCTLYKDGILANNALHWVVYPKEASDSIASKVILAFDLVSEEYCEFPCPHGDCHHGIVNDWSLCMPGTLGGCLCVEYWTMSWDRMDVWVMKEYGVKESWTRLFSLSYPGCFCSCPCRTTLTYWKSSDKVLLIDDCKKEYIIYDLKTEMMIKKVKFPFHCHLHLNPKICVQSLVVLNDNGWKTIEEEGEGEEQKTEVQPSGMTG